MRYIYPIIMLATVLILGCRKYPCRIVVPAKFQCEEVQNLKYIIVHFYQGARPIMADVIYGVDFVDGVYEIEYEFFDTNPDLLLWRVYEYDRVGWTQYETKIP